MKKIKTKKPGRNIFIAAIIITASCQANGQCIYGDCGNGYGVYIDDDKSTYSGFFRNGEPNGLGIYIYDNGDTYLGNFSQGQFNGHGAYLGSDDGSKYIGHWENGNRQGIGTETDIHGNQETHLWEADNTVERNEWKGCICGSCQIGFGVAILDNGSIYEGNWKNGKPNGQGKLTEKNGTTYQGEFLDGMFEGFGTLSSPDGTSESGLWSRNRFHGKMLTASLKGAISGNCENGYGIYVYDDASYYVGQWKNHLRNGLGTLYSASGQETTAIFKDGQIDGYACINYNSTRTDGVAKYIGDVRNNEANGFGAFYFKDGSIIYGQMRDGKANGECVHISANRKTKKPGIYADGLLSKPMDESEFSMINGKSNGFGIKYTEAGLYTGMLENGRPEGQGALRMFNGDMVAGNCFASGGISGKGIMRYADGKTYAGDLADGKPNGIGTLYSVDGTSISGTFSNGIILTGSDDDSDETLKPKASWINPQYPDNETYDNRTTIEFCVASQSPIQEIEIYVNGVKEIKAIPLRGLYETSSYCDYGFEFDIDLKPGANLIKVQIRNKDGISITEPRYINRLQK